MTNNSEVGIILEVTEGCLSDYAVKNYSKPVFRLIHGNMVEPSRGVAVTFPNQSTGFKRKEREVIGKS